MLVATSVLLINLRYTCDGEHTNSHVSGVRSMLATLFFLFEGILEKNMYVIDASTVMEMSLYPCLHRWGK